ncbi:F-actin-capping protein subunit beta [Orbilia brochopaga]|uniref:F-actin-capping protein subunit beta n=1 Tax=Orbilia brochopaga TaxID=3140254 RepID=A0AAV9V4C8_9PEZI
MIAFIFDLYLVKQGRFSQPFVSSSIFPCPYSESTDMLFEPLKQTGGMIAHKAFGMHRIARYLSSFQLLCLLALAFFLLSSRSVYDGGSSSGTGTSYFSGLFETRHPIERLILEWTRKHQEFVRRQSKTPEEAIKAYKKRYKRNPPPGFARWAKYAIAQNSSVIDDFDIIEERIAPFREITPFDLWRRIRLFQDTAGSFGTVTIADGKSRGDDRLPRSIEDIIDQLPDIELLYTWLDEPRVIGIDTGNNKIEVEELKGKDAWSILTEKCHFTPESERQWKGRTDPKIKYVDDPKKALDICSHPEYRDKHGFFNSPSNFPSVRNLVPVFACATMSTMSDIIAPGLDYINPGYLGDKNGDPVPYSEKKAQMYWKAWSTGSEFKLDTYKTNHRVRFVEKFGKHPMFNIGFSRYVQCGDICSKLEELVGLVPNDDAKVGFQYKFAMDIDGNGYSGRYYRLLQSNCLVFKQTMWEQWHDDRLFPWVHYIPVSLGLDELESMVDYFANDPKGIVYGEKIAEQGKLWSKQVLRPVDITIYTYRLLLEYADLFDEKRVVKEPM